MLLIGVVYVIAVAACANAERFAQLAGEAPNPTSSGDRCVAG